MKLPSISLGTAVAAASVGIAFAVVLSAAGQAAGLAIVGAAIVYGHIIHHIADTGSVPLLQFLDGGECRHLLRVRHRSDVSVPLQKRRGV